MAAMNAFFLVLFFAFAHGDMQSDQSYGDDSRYNSNCPDLSNALGKDCKISSDCTKITCTISDQGDKVLTWTIKINKCEDPVTVDISVEAVGIRWSKTFSSDERVAVPGLSMSVLGQSVGVYAKVKLEDTGSKLQLEVQMLFGIKVFGEFKQIGDAVTLVDVDLPITTYECGIVRWWKGIGTTLQILVIVGAIVIVLGSFCCCYCCCCRRKSPGTVLVQGPPPAATVISTNNTTVPMKPFVDEI